MKLYLFLLDDFESCYYFQGIYSDTPESIAIIERIVRNTMVVGYQIVKGSVIKEYTKEPIKEYEPYEYDDLREPYDE
jgi:hypothetical protein